MRYFSKFLGVSAALMLLSATVVAAEERDPLKPRVPPDQMAEAKQMKNPVEATPENIAKGKPSLLGAVTGAVAGLVAVTPASGFAGPMGAIVLGIIAGAVCYISCSAVKSALGYDDALDVFGVHCIGGIVGALLTGILANPALGGTGIFDYAAGKVADFDTVTQLIAQAKAVCLTLVWSGVVSFILYKNKAHQQAVNKKVMAEMQKKPMPKDIPFDMKRMAYGAFKAVVQG